MMPLKIYKKKNGLFKDDVTNFNASNFKHLNLTTQEIFCFNPNPGNFRERRRT